MALAFVKKNSVLLGITAAGISSLGALYLARCSFYRVLSSWNTRRHLKAIDPEKIILVSKPSEWHSIAETVINQSKKIGAVGFDCEWVSSTSRHPVALLQLAPYCGTCVLIRLHNFQDDIPQSLVNYLSDESILKVGVVPGEDSRYLKSDYGIQVNGCLDLRHLAVQDRCSTSDEEQTIDPLGLKLGLASLSLYYLGRKLDKTRKIRTCDWEASELTTNQITYAANDALSGIQILLCLIDQLCTPTFQESLTFTNRQWEVATNKKIQKLCMPFIDAKFCLPKKEVLLKNNGIGITTFKSNRPYTTMASNKPLPKGSLQSYSVRKTPLYHNSLLWAPDNEPLCTCDPQKAMWYVEKNLGELISEEPLIVRLKFEPAGRPQKEGGDGQFYLQERYNICAVCGKTDSYIRKNVVPHEYRKHFPEVLKAHQSHDVLLLCTKCHQLSNHYDNNLRYRLAVEYDAPIGCETDIKTKIDRPLIAVRSAAGALYKKVNQLPLDRITELEEIVRKYYNVEILTRRLIKEASELDVKIHNENYLSHSFIIYDSYKQVGISKLEIRWRQHFLDTMKPKYLPNGWSITHNHKKMEIKMARLPLDHPERESYRIVLVGTEGYIDIPYVPPMPKVRYDNEMNADFPILSNDNNIEMNADFPILSNDNIESYSTEVTNDQIELMEEDHSGKWTDEVDDDIEEWDEPIESSSLLDHVNNLGIEVDQNLSDYNYGNVDNKEIIENL